MSQTRTRRRCAGARVLVAALAAAGTWTAGAAADVEQSRAADAQVRQTRCPVMTTNEIKPEFHTDYEGKRVYFCCRFCLEAFRAAPGRYLAALPQFKFPTRAAAGGGGGGDTEDHEHRTWHDHAVDHAGPHGAARLLRFAGRFHPLMVHFPIALVIAAGVAELLGAVTGRSFFRDAGRFAMVLGALCAACAAALGWAAGAFAEYPGEFGGTLRLHRWLGTAAAAGAVVGAVLCELSHRRGGRAAAAGYRIVLALSVAAVALAGYLGGELVYGPNHYVW